MERARGPTWGLRMREPAKGAGWARRRRDLQGAQRGCPNHGQGNLRTGRRWPMGRRLARGAGGSGRPGSHTSPGSRRAGAEPGARQVVPGVRGGAGGGARGAEGSGGRLAAWLPGWRRTLAAPAGTRGGGGQAARRGRAGQAGTRARRTPKKAVSVRAPRALVLRPRQPLRSAGPALPPTPPTRALPAAVVVGGGGSLCGAA